MHKGGTRGRDALRINSNTGPKPEGRPIGAESIYKRETRVGSGVVAAAREAQRLAETTGMSFDDALDLVLGRSDEDINSPDDEK